MYITCVSQLIKEALRLAEVNHMESVSFPALGTGRAHCNQMTRHLCWLSYISIHFHFFHGNFCYVLCFCIFSKGENSFDIKAMAKVMLDALGEFADTQPQHTQLVKIIVYHQQPHILKIFCDELKSRGGKKSWWNSITTYFFGKY